MNKVIHWDLTLKFQKKEQASAFIEFLNSQDIELGYEYRPEFEGAGYVYYVDLTDVPWAENLEDMAVFLKTIDHTVDD